MNTVMRIGLVLIFWFSSAATQADVIDAPHYNGTPHSFPETMESTLQTNLTTSLPQAQKQTTALEPGALILLGFGVVGLYFCRRKHRYPN